MVGKGGGGSVPMEPSTGRIWDVVQDMWGVDRAPVMILRSDGGDGSSFGICVLGVRFPSQDIYSMLLLVWTSRSRPARGGMRFMVDYLHKTLNPNRISFVRLPCNTNITLLYLLNPNRTLNPREGFYNYNFI